MKYYLEGCVKTSRKQGHPCMGILYPALDREGPPVVLPSGTCVQKKPAYRLLGINRFKKSAVNTENYVILY
jgi:hypothetical protein